MQTSTRVGNHAFPKTFAIILYLFLLIASYVLTAPSPAMAQSSPTHPSDAKEEKDA